MVKDFGWDLKGKTMVIKLKKGWKDYYLGFFGGFVSCLMLLIVYFVLI